MSDALTDEARQLAVIEFEDHGIFAEHNMPCAVCGQYAAVYTMNTGKFGPCWKCQKDGWATLRVTGWRRRLLHWLGLLKWYDA